MDQTDDELIKRWQQDGDERARDILLRRYKTFLREEAFRATRVGLDFDDAFQMGAMGFLHALDKYEFGHGTSLKTYARHWVRQRIHHGRQNLGPVACCFIGGLRYGPRCCAAWSQQCLEFEKLVVVSDG